MKFTFTIMVLLAISIVGCSKKSEEQQLKDFRSSLAYRTYKFASENATKYAVSEYNKKSTEKIDEKSVHGLLGIILLTANKPNFACIEADTFTSLNKEPTDKLGSGIRIIAFHKMKWPRLSKMEYEALKSNLSSVTGKTTNSLALEHKLTLIVYLFVGLHLQENDITKSSAQALGAICNLDYIEPLALLAIDAREGNMISGVQRLNELRNSPHFSKHKQALLNEFQAILSEQGTQGKASENVIERLSFALIKGIVTDIFSSAELNELLTQATKFTKTFGEKNPEGGLSPK